MRILFLTLFLTLTSCASSSSKDGTWRMPAYDEGSQARPEAYGSDGYTFSKDQPHRPDPKPWEFFYKRCSISDSDFYSAHSYDCTGPSF